MDCQLDSSQYCSRKLGDTQSLPWTHLAELGVRFLLVTEQQLSTVVLELLQSSITLFTP